MILKDVRSNFINSNTTIAAYLKEINKCKVLTQSEEEKLVDEMLEGNEEAKNKLILANQRFVYAVAKRYGNDDNILDLVSEGNIGLMSALETFDKSRGNRFLSYAIWYIRREINAYLNNDNLLIKKTNNAKTTYKIPKIKSKFYTENNRYPNNDEIAEILEKEYGLKIKDKNDLLDVTTTSISTCFDDEDNRAFENTPYFTNKTAINNEYEVGIQKEHNSSITETLISQLSNREKTVIKMAFGIGYNKEYTNAEIGEEVNMSSERVRQLKNNAIKKMHQFAESKHISY